MSEFDPRSASSSLEKHQLTARKAWQYGTAASFAEVEEQLNVRGGYMLRRAFAVFTVGMLMASASPGQERVDFVLNFVASGDHAPYYFARKQGWYKEAGIDLDIELGQGSAAAVQKVGAGKNQLGIADLGNAMVGARAPMWWQSWRSMPTHLSACTG